MRSRLFAVVLAALVLLPLFGGIASGADVQTIEILLNADAGDYKQAAVQRFMKENPDIRVNLTLIGVNDLTTKLHTILAARGPLDVFETSAVSAPELAKAEWVEPVDDLFTPKERADLIGLEHTVYKGKAYGVPFIVDPYLLWYNKRVLKEAGFENPPATLDELKQQCLKLMKDGAVRYGFASAMIPQFIVPVCREFIAACGGDFWASVETWESAMNSKATRNAISFLADGFLVSKWISPKSLTADWKECRMMLMAGDIAFTLCAPYGYRQLSDPATSPMANDVGWCLIPAGRPDIQPGHGAKREGQALFITSYSKKKDAARRFVRYFVSRPEQLEMVLNTKMMPVHRDVYKDEKVLKMLPYLPVARTEVERAIGALMPPYQAEFMRLVAQELALVFTGKKSVDEGIKAMDEHANRLREEYR